jgi:hypothetical protein
MISNVENHYLKDIPQQNPKSRAASAPLLLSLIKSV